jgi:hypothetical protein
VPKQPAFGYSPGRAVALTSKAEFPISRRNSSRVFWPAATPSVKQRQRGTAPGVV